MIPVKMATDEFVYFLLCKCMTILELVQRGKLLHVETIRQDDICQQPNTTLQLFVCK